MDFGIQGKRALVCAASKGLGRAVAEALAEEGVELFLCARGEDTLNVVADAIAAKHGRLVHRLACDLSVESERKRLIEAVNQAFSGVDILLHNVGGPKPSTVETTPNDAWRQGFEQLFMSVIHLNEAFLPGMKARQWGRILIVTSTSVAEPIPSLAVSNAIRAAVTGMAKTLATDVAANGVTVNCVAPGIIHTDRTEERIQAEIQRQGGTREQYLVDFAKAIPAARLGTPQEYAAMVCFLASQQASYVTGSTIFVDGGKRHSTY